MKIGIDLGSNSIGWAVVSDNSILASGVRVFPEGINRVKGTVEESKNLKRRLARQVRRQYFRKRMRKNILWGLLEKEGMAPSTEDLKAWREMNPYTLRDKATEEEVTPLEFGRIMYHLSQRRGFKSSMKGADNEEGKIFDGDLKIGKIGITQTEQGINTGGYATLGSYLNSLNPHEERIRNRYTTRKMYRQEFEIIWNVQKAFQPNRYNEDLYNQLGHEKTGVLFFQRPLRSQKALIGKCTFERNKPRIPSSHPMNQEYRAWCMINNIRYGENQKLTDAQRWQILQLAGNQAKLTIAQIKKKLKLLEEFNYEDDSTFPCLTTSFQLNKHFGSKVDLSDTKTADDLWHLFYEAQDPDWLVDKLQLKYAFSEEEAKAVVKGKNRIRLEEGYGSLSALAIRRILPFLKEGYRYDVSVLLAGLCKVMGGDFWGRLSGIEKETLVGNIKAASETRAKGTIRENLWNYIVAEYGVPEKATAADLYHHSDLDSQQDLLDALPEPKKLRNPIVEQALFEMRSLVNALIKEHGKPDRMVLEMARELKNPKKKREEMLSNNRKREMQRNEIKQKLIDEGIRPTGYNITKFLLWEESKEQCPYTGRSIPRSELFDDGIWQIEHIVPYSVSLDDSFGNKTICHADENRRKGNKTPWQFYNFSEGNWAEVKERAKMIFCKGSYPKYIKFINEREPKADDFLSRQLNDTRYMATEAKAYLQKICSDVVVTPGGVTAELRHLWGLDGILSPSIPTELPFDGPGWLVTESDGRIVEFVAWSNAHVQGKIEEKLSKKGIVWSGEMRMGVFYPGKNRDDHRHHAVDAIAIACTERSFVQAISTGHSTGKWLKSEVFQSPWPNFFQDAKRSIDQILVSHKKRKRLLTTRLVKQKINGVKIQHKLTSPRDQLHDETFFGKVLDPNTRTEVFTTRKPLSSITKVKQLRMITDPRILALIDVRAQELGVDLSQKDADLPKNFFFEPDENGIPIPTLYLPGGTERASIPVKKVRVRVVSSNMALRNESTQQYAEPGNNYLAAIIEDSNGVWREEILSFWTAVKRAKNKEPLIGLNQGETIRYIFQANDLYLLNWPKNLNPETAPRELLSKHLYRVQKFSSMFYVFRKHNASTLAFENEEIRIRSFSALNAKSLKKLSIDNLGRLRISPKHEENHQY